MSRGTEITIENARPHPWDVIFEPYGITYRLKMGDHLRVKLVSSQEEPYFKVCEHDDVTQVYCENMEDFETSVNGIVDIPFDGTKVSKR